MRTGVLAAIVATIAIFSCKHAMQAKLKDADPPPDPSNATPVSFYEPYALADAEISQNDLIQMVQGINPDFTGDQVVSTVLPHGERVLVATEPNGRVTPLVSFDQGQLYEWWMTASAQPISGADGQYQLQRQNLLLRVPQGGDPQDPGNALFAAYQRASGDVDLVPVAQHAITSTGILRRAGNDFLDENHQLTFSLTPLSANIWRLDGRINSPYMCDGAVIWRSDPGFFNSVLTEFGQPTYFRWSAEGTSMRLVGPLAAPDEQAAAMATMAHDCPYRSGDSLAQLLDSLAYSPESQFGATPGPAAAPATVVAPGGKVVVDNAVWVVLSVQKRMVSFAAGGTSSQIDVYDYMLTNHSRTYAEDGGRQYSRVYNYNGETQELAFLGSSLWFMQSVPPMIAAMSQQRIAAPKQIAALQQEATLRLNLAEKKAAEIDTPQKLGLVLASQAVNELAMASFATADSSFMGLKTFLASDKDAASGLNVFRAVNNIVRTSPEFRQRALAALYLTGIQSMVNATDIITTSSSSQPFGTVAENVATTIAQTALTNGLLTLSPIVRDVNGTEVLQAGGIVASGLSGVSMRWRKMSVEASKGIDNGAAWQQNLNLVAGAVTQVAYGVISFTFHNTGLNNAISSGGVLVSEVISGRANPGLIIGQTVESLSGLVSVSTLFGPTAAKVIPDPLVRPGAITAGKMANAYIQFQGAIAYSSYVSGQLDAAIALKGRQLAMADALRFMMKHNADLVGRLPRSDRNQLLATAQDPEADVRLFFLSQQAH